MPKAPKMETRLRKAKRYLNTQSSTRSPYPILSEDVTKVTRKFNVPRKKLKSFLLARKKDTEDWQNRRGKWRF